MANAIVNGPKFQIESDRAVIGLGHSERKEVGEAWGSALDNLGIFEKIDVVTLNRAASMFSRVAIRKLLDESTVFGHSAFLTRVPSARQIVAISPPEPVPFFTLLARALNDVTKEPIEKEAEAHKTGFADMVKASIEMARSPISTFWTPFIISRGFSSVDRLVNGREDFPAGRAIVHASLDAFRFAELANMDYAAANGVTTVELPGMYHNEVLFAPKRVLSAITPAILPERELLS